jgi:imidazolonepropionase-like amidohydrolase
VKAPVDASGSGTLVVRAGRVFTARDETDPDVVGLVVREGKIQALLSPADPLPPGADVVDFGPDATLLPGLIDCHVHLTGTRTYGGSAPAPPYLRAARAVADLEALLRAGYTTVRELGSAVGYEKRCWKGA